MSKPKAIFCWSGGKDSSYCLYKVLKEELFDVRYLLTTINGNFNRISMHGVREELLDAQARSVGIPLLKVKVFKGTNEEYERKMKEVLIKVKSEGISNVIFGDIFLEDLRKYREEKLSKVSMKAVFPLWKLNTREIMNDFLSKQFRAVTCCVDEKHLEKEFVGREVDASFVDKLAPVIDPCGENGEYHSFCYDGPLFKKKIDFEIGEKTYKEPGLWFCDLLPIFSSRVFSL